MSKFDDKVNKNTVDATEYNNLARAPKNAIEDSGQVINDGDNTQLSKAMANYASVSTYYTDSGIANAYVLSSIGSFKAPTAYADGMEIRFRAGNANTAASTVNVGGLGVKNIKKADGTTDINANDISSSVDTTLRFDAGNDVFLLDDDSQFSNITINNKLNTQPNSTTISSGAITYTGAYMVIDTEGGAATDDLATINGGVDGDILILRISDTNRFVNISINTGNIFGPFVTGTRCELINLSDRVILQKSGTVWHFLSREIFNDFATSRATNGYTYLPNGLIMQWGVKTGVGTSLTTVILPITHSNATLQVLATTRTNNRILNVTGFANASFQAQVNTSTATIGWMTIGY